MEYVIVFFIINPKAPGAVAIANGWTTPHTAAIACQLHFDQRDLVWLIAVREYLHKDIEVFTLDEILKKGM